MTREMQEAIPTGRSPWSYALLIPGVRVHKPDVGGSAGVQQSEMMGRGLDAAHNTVEIDGMTVDTMVSDGRYQAYLNPMLATETSYTMSGHGAETQTGGLRINMIPAEGGDRFGGNVFIGGAPHEADNVNPRLEALGVSRPARARLYDVNGSFGGPVLRDRLRFFTSARRNAADFGVGYRGALQGEAGENSLASANGRLTWQVTPRHKLSVMLDKARKRRFGQHGPGVDLGTAASTWTSPHYDTGTPKWTGAPGDRLLAEFGFSLSYQDWDANYYQHRRDGPSIFQPRPDADGLAACFETPCFPPVGSARHAAQLAPALGGDPWYSQVATRDGLLGLLYGAKADGENNNYTRRWAYRGALSHVTGSHRFSVGMNFSRGRNRHTNTSNGHLELRYEDAPNPRGRLIQDQHQGLPWFDCSHPRAQANRDAGRPCGLMGTPDRVVVYNHPSNLAYQLDYNGGFYAQDSWTVDRLTLDYGMRLDFAAMSVPDAPRGLGRFVPAQRQPGRPAGDLPRFGPDVSPRLSVAYDLFGDARTVLKHRAGRHRHRRAKHRRHVVPHDPGEQREVPAVLVAARRERPEGVRCPQQRRRSRARRVAERQGQHGGGLPGPERVGARQPHPRRPHRPPCGHRRVLTTARARRSWATAKRAGLDAALCEPAASKEQAVHGRQYLRGDPSGTTADSSCGTPALMTGISSHVRPSSTRPVRFLNTPPHCLKKKGTLLRTHVSRIARTHRGCTGRAPGPDSPPAITQSTPDRSKPGNGPRRGSSDRNFVRAPVPTRSSRRSSHRFDSMLTPSQMFGVQRSRPSSALTRSGRLVNT